MNQPNFKPATVWIGDNLEIMRGMNSGCIDLIYLDPPFNSNRNYEAPVGGDAVGSFKDVWHFSDLKAHEHGELADRHPGLYKVIEAAGAAHGEPMMAYLIMMGVRLLEMKRLLKDTGSIYLHVDPTASHYLKLVMDCVFGADQYKNEIIWHYKKWTNNAKFWQRNHDVIVYYSKTDDYAFRKLHGALTANQHAILKAGYNAGSSNTGQKIVRVYDRAKTAHLMPKWEAEGRKVYYVDGEVKGPALPDVWNMPILSGGAKERCGYPTQKPEALLERIIKASSNEHDLVFDPFCGCATTLVAANNLNRNWVGCDLSETAVGLVKQRMDKVKGMPNSGLFTSQSVITLKQPPVRTDLDAPLPDYKSAKHLLFSIQKGVCAGCHENHTFRVLTVDHIVPQSKGGQDDFDNLQLMCGPCNSSKGKRLMAVWLAERDPAHYPLYNPKFNPRRGD